VAHLVGSAAAFSSAVSALVALVLDDHHEVVGDPHQFLEHPRVLGVDVLERLDRENGVEAAVVELGDEPLDGTDVEGPRVGKRRVRFGHHLEGLRIEVDSVELPETGLVEPGQVSPRATSQLQDGGSGIEEGPEDVKYRLAALVGTVMGVVGGRVRSRSFRPEPADVCRFHPHARAAGRKTLPARDRFPGRPELYCSAGELPRHARPSERRRRPL